MAGLVSSKGVSDLQRCEGGYGLSCGPRSCDMVFLHGS
jgi:hypothetical protein